METGRLEEAVTTYARVVHQIRMASQWPLPHTVQESQNQERVFAELKHECYVQYELIRQEIAVLVEAEVERLSAPSD
jgi:hypothetical protein